MSYKSGCVICGKELHYLKEMVNMECAICKKTFESNVQCSDKHYICDQCHSLEADDFIKTYTLNASSKNPIEMAVFIMQNRAVKMHGPEHHFLVPAVLLAAYYNCLGDEELKKSKINEAKRRAKHILGGFCGFYGNCGAGVGTGMYMSLVTDANPLSQEAWKLSNLMTAESLFEIAKYGGPRCCKRDSFLAIEKAAAFSEKHLKVKMEMPDHIRCYFASHNVECLYEQCPYYRAKVQAV